MDTEAIFKALANPVRRQILQWLRAPEQYLPVELHDRIVPGSMCAGHIERLGGVSQ